MGLPPRGGIVFKKHWQRSENASVHGFEEGKSPLPLDNTQERGLRYKGAYVYCWTPLRDTGGQSGEGNPARWDCLAALDSERGVSLPASHDQRSRASAFISHQADEHFDLKVLLASSLGIRRSLASACNSGGIGGGIGGIVGISGIGSLGQAVSNFLPRHDDISTMRSPTDRLARPALAAQFGHNVLGQSDVWNAPLAKHRAARLLGGRVAALDAEFDPCVRTAVRLESIPAASAALGRLGDCRG